MNSRTRIFCIALLAALSLLLYLPGALQAQDGAPDAPESDVKAQNAVVAPTPHEEDNLAYVAPHKALYAFKLVKIESGTQLSNIAGQMFFELNDTCDAWTTDHRFDLQYDYAERPSADMTSEFNTWEAKTGRTFHFSYKRKANEKVMKELRGTVDQAPDGTTSVSYHTPKDLEVELPDGTFFPVTHTLEVARNALAGTTFFNTPVFDGSDDKGASLANVFIGKPVNAVAELAPDPAIDMDLLNGRAWRVRLAFFQANGKEAEPEYEMTAILHQNGVISDVVIDYPSFTIHQELTAIEALPMAEGCN